MGKDAFNTRLISVHIMVLYIFSVEFHMVKREKQLIYCNRTISMITEPCISTCIYS